MHRNEAGLRLALEAGEMGSWEWNIRTGAIRWSENLESIHGLAPGSFDGTFDSFKALIHPEDREVVLATISRSIEGRINYEAEFRSLESGGHVRWMLGKGKVLTDEEGVPSRMIGICMDITKRKRAEQAILEADRRKDEFLAMVSHELRNPLSAIVTASTLLDRMPTGDPVSSTARAMIKRQAERLTRIVEDLLDISRLTAGKLQLRRAPLDFGPLVEGCVKDLEGLHFFERHRHDVSVVSAPIHGDSARLEQVVTNLLTNAVKYTPPGGMIAVRVETVGEEAVLHVRDTGVGISLDLLPRIFDLFVQSERELDGRDGGLGLGLSIVRRLVEAHGGRVDARSGGTGLGAELTVHLPLAVTSVARAELARDEEGSAAPRCIVVIDDDSDSREALVALLELAGHEVHQAHDGPSGLESASRFKPDAVVVDIGMPGFDGFELARQIRTKGSAPRLIALTGYGDANHRRLGAEVGFDAYLVKPVDLDAVLREISG